MRETKKKNTFAKTRKKKKKMYNKIESNKELLRERDKREQAQNKSKTEREEYDNHHVGRILSNKKRKGKHKQAYHKRVDH